jgi:putative colanic acid biosynthesis UDP-glucose lipid carrier transferase
MYTQHKLINFVRLSFDNVLMIFSFLIAIVLLGNTLPNDLNNEHYILLFSLMIVWFFSSHSTKLYDDFRSRNFTIELIILFKNIFVQLICAIIILYIMDLIFLSKTFSFIYVSILFFFIGTQKYFLRRILYKVRKKGRNLRNVLIIGAGDTGKNFYDALQINSQFGYKIIGFLDDEKKPYLNGQYLGEIRDLELVLNSKVIDQVVIALPNYASDQIESITKICDRYTTRVIIIPDYLKYVSDRYKISMFGRFPVINVRAEKLQEPQWEIAKRLFDITFSIFLIFFVFTWLFPVIAIAIKLTSPGPVFFKQERWGRKNKKFTAYKFRSMGVQSKDVNENGAYQQAEKNDPRITKIGSILRKTNLDEFPQFFNVLKGDMSIVGPRPHPTPLNLQSKEKIDLYMVRHYVKPGLTGWAQVNGFRGETRDDEAMKKRVGYDLWYIENWSFWLDIQIIFLTVWRMIVGDPNAY